VREDIAFKNAVRDLKLPTPEGPRS
jgi:hypothetical protein